MESNQPAPTDAARQARGLVAGLYLSAAITIVAGIALGFVLDPVWFGLVLLGLVDGVFAALFAGGRIGPLAARRQAELEGDAAAVAESDPAYNPYARED